MAEHPNNRLNTLAFPNELRSSPHMTLHPFDTAEAALRAALPAACFRELTPAYLEEPRGRYASAGCLLYTSPSPRDRTRSRMPSSA